MAASKAALLLFAVFFILLINDSIGHRRFWKGRHHGGNLLTPIELDRGLLPPDEWFDQKLTHFDAANTKTWKQVSKTKRTIFGW